MSKIPNSFDQLTSEQKKEIIHDVATYRQLQLQRQGQSQYGDSPHMPDMTLADFLEQLSQDGDPTEALSGFDAHPLLGRDGGAPQVPSVQSIENDLANLINSSSDSAELLIQAHRKKHQLKFNPEFRKQLQQTYKKVFSPKPY